MEAFFGGHPSVKPDTSSEDTIEKQRLFLDKILVKRKIEELKSNTSQQVLLFGQELRKEVQKSGSAASAQAKRMTLGKRTFSSTFTELKEQLAQRAGTSRKRFHKMKLFCAKFEQMQQIQQQDDLDTLAEQLKQIKQIREEIKTEFVETYGEQEVEEDAQCDGDGKSGSIGG